MDSKDSAHATSLCGKTAGGFLPPSNRLTGPLADELSGPPAVERPTADRRRSSIKPTPGWSRTREFPGPVCRTTWIWTATSWRTWRWPGKRFERTVKSGRCVAGDAWHAVEVGVVAGKMAHTVGLHNGHDESVVTQQPVLLADRRGRCNQPRWNRENVTGVPPPRRGFAPILRGCPSSRRCHTSPQPNWSSAQS